MDIHSLSFIIKFGGWFIILSLLIKYRKCFPTNLFYLGLMAFSFLLFASAEEFITDGILLNDKVMWILADILLMGFIGKGIYCFRELIKMEEVVKRDMKEKKKELIE